MIAVFSAACPSPNRSRASSGSGGASSGRTGTTPRHTRTQRAAASSSRFSTHATTNTVRIRLSRPLATCPLSIMAGKKLPTICTAAVIVVAVTNSIGGSVTQA